MAAVTYTATHTVAGELGGGLKLVYTNLVGDAGTAGVVAITISPLNHIIEWALSVKDPDTTATPRTFQAVKYAANASGADNQIDIVASGATTNPAYLEIVSIGV